MTKIFNLLTIVLCIFFVSCQKKSPLTLEFQVEGVPPWQKQFNTYEDAATWFAGSCKPLFFQLNNNEASSSFSVSVQGLDIEGTAFSAVYQFRKSPEGARQLVQLDGDAVSVKLDGNSDKDWAIVEAYLRDEIMFNGVFATVQ